MYFERDWMMRQIQMLAQFVARTIFLKEYIVYEIIDEEHRNDMDDLYIRLRALLMTGDLCGAEDALFDGYDGSENYLRLATWFYSELNTFTDDALEAASFPREEIEEGLRDVLGRYYIPLPPRVE